MSITDNAIRTALRAELSSEFFTSPQKYLLGADKDLFNNSSKWEAYIGNIFAVSKDEDGDTPTFGQLSQMSMQPHTDYMRSLAAQFAGETGIPISSLGVIHDNPASAEAIYAAKEDLIIEAEALNETNGAALRNIGLLVEAIAGNKTLAQLTDDERRIQTLKGVISLCPDCHGVRLHGGCYIARHAQGLWVPTCLPLHGLPPAGGEGPPPHAAAGGLPVLPAQLHWCACRVSAAFELQGRYGQPWGSPSNLRAA